MGQEKSDHFFLANVAVRHAVPGPSQKGVSVEKVMKSFDSWYGQFNLLPDLEAHRNAHKGWLQENAVFVGHVDEDANDFEDREFDEVDKPAEMQADDAGRRNQDFDEMEFLEGEGVGMTIDDEMCVGDEIEGELSDGSHQFGIVLDRIVNGYGEVVCYKVWCDCDPDDWTKGGFDYIRADQLSFYEPYGNPVKSLARIGYKLVSEPMEGYEECPDANFEYLYNEVTKDVIVPW